VNSGGNEIRGMQVFTFVLRLVLRLVFGPGFASIFAVVGGIIDDAHASGKRRV
jgi:hypothetical protein